MSTNPHFPAVAANPLGMSVSLPLTRRDALRRRRHGCHRISRENDKSELGRKTETRDATVHERLTHEHLSQR